MESLALGPSAMIGQDGSFGTCWNMDCKVMTDIAKISPCVSSTCAPNAIFLLPIRAIITSHQLYVSIDNPSLIPSVSCHTTSSYRNNYVRTADNVSHTDDFQIQGWR